MLYPVSRDQLQNGYRHSLPLHCAASTGRTGLFSTGASITPSTRTVALPLIVISTTVYAWKFLPRHPFSRLESRLTNKYPCFALRHIHCFPAGCYPSTLGWFKTLCWEYSVSNVHGLETSLASFPLTLHIYYTIYFGTCQALLWNFLKISIPPVCIFCPFAWLYIYYTTRGWTCQPLIWNFYSSILIT